MLPSPVSETKASEPNLRRSETVSSNCRTGSQHTNCRRFDQKRGMQFGRGMQFENCMLGTKSHREACHATHAIGKRLEKRGSGQQQPSSGQEQSGRLSGIHTWSRWRLPPTQKARLCKRSMWRRHTRHHPHVRTFSPSMRHQPRQPRLSRSPMIMTKYSISRNCKCFAAEALLWTSKTSKQAACLG